MTMEEFERRILNELEELRSNYCRDVLQLEEIYSSLKEKCSQLSVENSNEHIDSILKPTIESVKNIEDALHKLYEATGAVQKFIQLQQVYSEIKP